jgi:hypothetical protein
VLQMTCRVGTRCLGPVRGAARRAPLERRLGHGTAGYALRLESCAIAFKYRAVNTGCHCYSSDSPDKAGIRSHVWCVSGSARCSRERRFQKKARSRKPGVLTRSRKPGVLNGSKRADSEAVWNVHRRASSAVATRPLRPNNRAPASGAAVRLTLATCTVSSARSTRVISTKIG